MDSIAFSDAKCKLVGACIQGQYITLQTKIALHCGCYVKQNAYIAIASGKMEHVVDRNAEISNGRVAGYLSMMYIWNFSPICMVQMHIQHLYQCTTRFKSQTPPPPP